jgi:hypothetical protein
MAADALVEVAAVVAGVIAVAVEVAVVADIAVAVAVEVVVVAVEVEEEDRTKQRLFFIEDFVILPMNFHDRIHQRSV